MFDASVFAEPNAFKTDRDAARYLHFGDGGGGAPAPHRCVGEAFAMAQLREMLKALMRLRGVRRAAGGKGQLEADNLLPTSLVIRFETN